SGRSRWRCKKCVHGMQEYGFISSQGSDGAARAEATSTRAPDRSVCQAQDAQAGAIASLGRVDEGGGLWADHARPVDETRRRPLEMPLVRVGHVGGIDGVAAPDIAAAMRSHALATMESLDRAHSGAHVADLILRRTRA